MASEHQKRIVKFMNLAQQEVPEKGKYSQENPPPVEVRKLRAALIIEEALETVRALGFMYADTGDLQEIFNYDHEEVIDGCADISVVTIGTLVALGVDDNVLEEVDRANLSKFEDGYSFREDGKLLKSPDFTPPDYTKSLEEGIDLSEL